MLQLKHRNACSIVHPHYHGKPLTLAEHIAAHVAELFRAFSDTRRVRTLYAILESEMNISVLAESAQGSENLT